MRKVLLQLCAAAAMASSVNAAPRDEDALLERLHQPVVLRGEFIQSRQIAGFRRPVESRGEFVVARGQGLLWHTRVPFESMLSVSRDRLRMTDVASGAVTTLDARREPMLRAINEVLQGVVVADVVALQRRFDLTVRMIGAVGWEVVLQPKDAILAARFTAITLRGATHVEQVRLAESNGDLTNLQFTNQREDSTLSPAEAGQLQ
jgi:hypothetical protein